MSDVIQLDSMDARAGSPARGIVCAGGVDTEYKRVGRGQPVVLLTQRSDTDPGSGDVSIEALVAQLAEGFLVIEPCPPQGVIFAEWFRDFLDGLGIARPSIIAEGSQCALALAFAESDEPRVARVALLCRGANDRASLIQFLQSGDQDRAQVR